MTIGLTYDLRSEYLKEGYSEEETAEFDREETIESIEKALQSFGYTTDRIGHIRNLTARLAKGDRWDMVFNIAEGMYGIGREAQVPALLDAYKIPYVFSDPLVLALTLHKGMCKHVIRDCKIPTPDFAVIHKPSDCDAVKLPMPLFAKPVAEGTGKGIDGKSKITSKKELKAVCTELLEKFKQPVLVETFLPGREFTVGIVGTGKEARVIGGMEIIFGELAEQDIYSFYNKEHYTNLVNYRKIEDKEILEQCTNISLSAWIKLGCVDGGRIDLRMDSNNIVNFMEVNPLAGLRPIHSDLVIIANMHGIEYTELIKMILNSAISRNNLK